MFTLDQLNIKSLNLNAQAANLTNNGNTIGLVSSYTTKDGQTHELADVWLASTDAQTGSINQLTDALNQYKATGLTGVSSTSGANGVNLTSGSANPDQANPVNQTLTAASNLENLVTTNSSALLVNALSQYNANGQLISNTINTNTPSPLNSVALGSSLAQNQLMGANGAELNTSSTIPTVTKPSN